MAVSVVIGPGFRDISTQIPGILTCLSSAQDLLIATSCWDVWDKDVGTVQGNRCAPHIQASVLMRNCPKRATQRSARHQSRTHPTPTQLSAQLNSTQLNAAPEDAPKPHFLPQQRVGGDGEADTPAVAPSTWNDNERLLMGSVAK